MDLHRIYRRLGVAACLVAVGTSKRAHAEDQPIRFDYVVPDGCPSEASFVERVRARTERARTAKPEEDAITFAVRVTTQGATKVARVEFTDARSVPVSRSVSGSSCEEVVSAIALVAAIAIEGRQSKAGPTPALTDAAAAPNVTTEPPTLREPDRPPESTPVGPRPYELGTGAYGVIEAWSGLTSAYGVGVYGELGASPPFRYVRVGLQRVTADASVGARNARFEWISGRVELCAWAWRMTPRLELASCAAIHGGALIGRGQESATLPDSRTKSVPWVETILIARARWRPAGWLVFDIAADLGVPLVRHTFNFDLPDEKVFRIPFARLGASAGLGALF